jgi:hypothetical protein
MARRSLTTLSWAVYLGCSWTWCIGMFLPVLMVRDYGLAGWFVFAIPNVVGAAAMGWMLAKPGHSEQIVDEHHSACVGFSAITLAFHAFFLSWLAIRIIPLTWCIAAVAAGSAMAMIARHRRSIDWVLAWVVLAISLIVLAYGLAHPRISETKGLKDAGDLVWLGPVCLFGFSLCPYLDLTFHQAKQATTPAGGRVAFTLGFAVFFLPMIYLTLLYEGDIVHGANYGSFGPVGLRTWVALHMAAQTGFTWMAHLRAQPKLRRGDSSIWIIAALIALAASIIVWVPSLEQFQQSHFEMLTGEAIYRIFMAFYGLVFPAYVWLCIIPGRSVKAWIAAVLVAAPMFWLGFIVGTMWWLGLGLVVVLGAKVFAWWIPEPRMYMRGSDRQ